MMFMKILFYQESGVPGKYQEVGTTPSIRKLFSAGASEVNIAVARQYSSIHDEVSLFIDYLAHFNCTTVHLTIPIK